jgi:excisionase family DNA binding protein
MKKTGSDAYSVRQVADKLGVDVKTAYVAIHAKQIYAIRIGDRIVVPKVPFDKKLEGEGA